MKSPMDMGRRAADAISGAATAALSEALSATLAPGGKMTRNRRGRVFFAPPVRVAVFGGGPASERLCGALKRLGFQPLLLPASYTLTDTWHATFSRYAQMCFVDIDAIARECDSADFLESLRAQHPDLPLVAMSQQVSTASPEAAASGPDSGPVSGPAPGPASGPIDGRIPAEFTGDDLAAGISAALSHRLAHEIEATMRKA